MTWTDDGGVTHEARPLAYTKSNRWWLAACERAVDEAKWAHHTHIKLRGDPSVAVTCIRCLAWRPR
jgi:hypothetical protein